jgi:hypothetical protein
MSIPDDADLPQLQSIQLEGRALAGDGRRERRGSGKAPYNWDNTLTMKRETYGTTASE